MAINFPSSPATDQVYTENNRNWVWNGTSWITGNQSITFSGDVTGSGTAAVVLTLASSGVTAGTYKSVTTDGKGRVTAGTNPTTLSGYGISDAVTLTGTQTVTNKTLTNPTITNYTETLHNPAAGTSFTVDLANGTMQKFTSSGNLTITLPAAAAGKSFTVIVNYGGTHTLTWAGGTLLKFAGGTQPTATGISGKIDIFNFYSDGASTFGSVFGLNF